MENEKEKILELINVCLDNKEFYSPGKETIHCGCPIYKDSFDCSNLFDNDIDSRRNYLFSKDVKMMNEAMLENKTINLPFSYMKITFQEQPPIEISCFNRVVSEQVIPYEIDEIYYIERRWWQIWKDKSSLVLTGYKIKKQIIKRHLEHYYKAKFGSILVNLSVEEVNKILKKYLENKEKFSKEILEDKKRREFDLINERIERYRNNKHKE